MKSKIGWVLLIVAGLTVGYFIGKGDTEVVKVPIRIEVPVPVIISDTIYKDSLIPIVRENPVNKELLKSYDDIKDSLKRRDAYIESITQRKYTETFEDSIQSITVIASTTGFLDSLAVAYKTKPRTIPLDTVVEIRIPKQRNISLYFETNAIMSPRPTFKLGADITTKKNFIYGTSIDSRSIIEEGRIIPWIKLGKKFNF